MMDVTIYIDIMSMDESVWCCKGHKSEFLNFIFIFLHLMIAFILANQSSSKLTNLCPPGVLWIWGEWLFIFRELGSTGNYFQGFGEQAHNFGDLGSPAEK